MMQRRNIAVEEAPGPSRAQAAQPGPMMALGMLIFMFSLAGIPPLAGFWGKLYIFMAAVEARLFVPAVLGVLASVVASYYYLRIVKVMYFDEPAEAIDGPSFGINRVVALVAAFLIAVFSLVPPAPQPDRRSGRQGSLPVTARCPSFRTGGRWWRWTASAAPTTRPSAWPMPSPRRHRRLGASSLGAAGAAAAIGRRLSAISTALQSCGLPAWRTRVRRSSCGRGPVPANRTVRLK